MQKVDVVREFVKKLNEDDLKFLHTRLTQNFKNDLVDVFEFLGENEEIDNWLKSVSSSHSFHDMLDYLSDQVEIEFKRKYKK